MTDQAEVARAVEVHLEGLLPGWMVIDRQLEIGDGPTADLVCTDGKGRLALVVLVEGGAQETVLSALETLSFLRRHAGVLARHIGMRLDENSTPRLVLLAEHFAPKATARLVPLLESEEDSLSLFELRTLKTERGEALWFSPVSPGADEAGLRVLTFESFVERLSDTDQGIARTLAADLMRADPAVRTEVRRSQVTWRLGDVELCTLSNKTGELVLQVPGHEGRPLEESFDRSIVLEPVLERLLEEVQGEAEPIEDEEDDDLGPLVLGNPEQLLTPEELEAFREP